MTFRRALYALAVLGSAFLVVACAQESGTVKPQVQQMKPGVRGGKH